jgi:hypothetical protein
MAKKQRESVERLSPSNRTPSHKFLNSTQTFSQNPKASRKLLATSQSSDSFDGERAGTPKKVDLMRRTYQQIITEGEIDEKPAAKLAQPQLKGIQQKQRYQALSPDVQSSVAASLDSKHSKLSQKRRSLLAASGFNYAPNAMKLVTNDFEKKRPSLQNRPLIFESVEPSWGKIGHNIALDPVSDQKIVNNDFRRARE